jgi:hypothetical protein
MQCMSVRTHMHTYTYTHTHTFRVSHKPRITWSFQIWHGCYKMYSIHPAIMTLHTRFKEMQWTVYGVISPYTRTVWSWTCSTLNIFTATMWRFYVNIVMNRILSLQTTNAFSEAKGSCKLQTTNKWQYQLRNKSASKYANLDEKV